MITMHEMRGSRSSGCLCSNFFFFFSFERMHVLRTPYLLCTLYVHICLQAGQLRRKIYECHVHGALRAATGQSSTSYSMDGVQDMCILLHTVCGRELQRNMSSLQRHGTVYE